MHDLDSPWKELLEQRLPDALAFFAPVAHAQTDWEHDHESLEQELRKLAPEGQTGRRVVDHLAKLTLKNGDRRYLRVEVQGRKDRAFRRRTWAYNTRASDHYGQPAASLALRIDANPNWRPRSYREEVWGTVKRLAFPSVKVLDWANRQEELERHANPVALFVLAHLLGQATRKKPEECAAAKLRLLRLLATRKLDEGEQARWYRWFDWLMPLPEEHAKAVWSQVMQDKQEGRMPFVSYGEKYFLKKGREEGRCETLLEAIALVLKVRFGPTSASFLPELQGKELPVLERVFNAIEGVGSLDELRALLPANGQANGA